jgi:hypothetical protein
MSREGRAVTDRLETLRGSATARHHNARTIAALTANPGCARRALLDAAGVDKAAVAQRLGHPAPFGQSRFAIVRGITFEARLKADDYAELRTLLNLDGRVPVSGRADLEGDGSLVDRYRRTRAALAAGSAVLDHPMLRLAVAGQPAYLEPDLLVRRGTELRVVEIKSFPVIDGQADPAKLAAAARQAAVYVLALRELLAERGPDAGTVADEVVLVCPENFTNRPVATAVDVRRQVAVLRRQLTRMTGVDELAAALPDGITFDPTQPVAELAGAVRCTSARYRPDCLASCDLVMFCRSEARTGGRTDVLGASVTSDFGGLEDLRLVVDLAHGRATPEPEHAEIAELLRTAQRLRAECLAGG